MSIIAFTSSLLGFHSGFINYNCLDLCFAVSSLSRFLVAPRQGHIKAATGIFKYLNCTREKWIFIDLEDLVHPGEPTRKYETSKMIDSYLGALGEVDPKLSVGMMEELDTSLYYDSNFAHDEAMRRSVLGMVGSTPVLGFNKRQGAIATTSTHLAEMYAAKVEAEEVIEYNMLQDPQE
jgi:hypothetical protein